jgi:hypothetical protein
VALTYDDTESTVGLGEVASLFLLIVPLAGWAVAMYLVWRSTVWDKRAKVIATIFGPGGIPTVLSIIILQAAHARGKTNLAGGEQSAAIAIAAVIVVGSFASIVYLGTRLRPTQPIDVA